MAYTEFEKLITIMDTLREKCPWDKKQTIRSLRQMTIEEMYELTEAISLEDWDNIKEELGDIMLHLVFYSKIAAEEDKFTIVDVINNVCEKLIKRHPHVYPPENKSPDLLEVNNEDDVKRNWEKLKLEEGKKSVLSGVPASLPSIIKAMRLQEKAKQVGFEWENKEDVWSKIDEELNELKEVVAEGAGRERQEEELGDVLFSLINYARFLKIDADAALEITNRKFKKRFIKMENIAEKDGKTINQLSLNEMDAIWNHIKSIEK